MRTLAVISITIILATFSVAQKPDQVLATATGQTIKLANLSPEVQTAVANLPESIAKQRKDLLDQLVYQSVIELEAVSQKLSVGQYIVTVKKKVPDPKEADIKAVYDENVDKLGGLTLAQARPRIIAFLRNEPESKAIEAMYTTLRVKYKVANGKDINVRLLPADIVVTINGKGVTSKEFEDFARLPLYELNAGLADVVIEDIQSTLMNALIAVEAKSRDLQSSDLIAQEITNKMKDFSDEERYSLEDAWMKRLFAKYQAKVLYTVPTPYVQNIAVDDDPAQGPATATVTIVMFSDFQCSACAATHPVLKRAITDFPGKVRLVVRDYPLESIHENGFKAALAANAANAQGKFFEYIEKLYANQDALDDVSLQRYAVDVGLNAPQFTIDFSAEKTALEVRRDMADGNSYGINSTPTIYVNGVKVRDLSYEGFKAAIERALKK
ncbi:MAG TPA: thioredoxin domain-containing protein [Pyrinomonadaceae bacterium]|nr:thioredoxin domain-containing protein [Pyrinomonadaceae bacterium]